MLHAPTIVAVQVSSHKGKEAQWPTADDHFEVGRGDENDMSAGSKFVSIHLGFQRVPARLHIQLQFIVCRKVRTSIKATAPPSTPAEERSSPEMCRVILLLVLLEESLKEALHNRQMLTEGAGCVGVV